jgi:hypothetical protein
LAQTVAHGVYWCGSDSCVYSFFFQSFPIYTTSARLRSPHYCRRRDCRATAQFRAAGRTTHYGFSFILQEGSPCCYLLWCRRRDHPCQYETDWLNCRSCLLESKRRAILIKKVNFYMCAKGRSTDG